MRGRHRGFLALLALLALRSSNAQELERSFCDDSDPATHCPGEDCLCVDDTLEIVFEWDLTNSIFEYNELPPEGLRIPSLVAAEVVSEQIRAYAAGILHDESALKLVSRDVTIVGTASEHAFDACFCAQRVLPNGYILAIVLSFSQPVVLPLGRVTLIKATYTLNRDVGPEGTVVRFTESLGSPPTQILYTIDLLSFPDMVDRDERNCINAIDDDGDGLTDRDDPDCIVRNGVNRQPRKLIDGLIRRRAVAVAPFRRGDADGNSKINITDAILVIQSVLGNVEPRFRCDDILDATDDGRIDMADGVSILRHIFQEGPALPAPFRDCADDPTPEALACEQSNCQAP